jgi:hypothetical protein
MTFTDITESVLRANWARDYLAKLTLMPTRVYNIEHIDRDANQLLVDINSVISHGKIGVYGKPSSTGFVLFVEHDEDMVLIKMFFD